MLKYRWICFPSWRSKLPSGYFLQAQECTEHRCCNSCKPDLWQKVISQSKCTSAFPWSQPDPWLWHGDGPWVVLPQKEPRFGEFDVCSCGWLWLGCLSGEWALEWVWRGGSSRAGSTTAAPGVLPSANPWIHSCSGLPKLSLPQIQHQGGVRGTILHSWACAEVESWQAKGRQGDSLLMTWFILCSC